ncbi:Esterase E4 [Gryllus bimaculatus]|nr:Esterase E4 [Gryllus bimaculatus]
MCRALTTLILLTVYGWVSVGAQDEPIVKVEQGQLRGREATSVLGERYYSFQGIPYAKPPVGELRFKDAQDPDAWDGVRDATVEGCMCTQLDRNDFQYRGCEDCLFLNVYTPTLPQTGAKPLPVMFWVHGGGFVFGAGNADVYGPDYLMEEGVVLVTINYRLTCFALRWVKKNIAAFNGDPNKVTFFGESAGGTSAHWHLMSPMSKGLFHGAISESGAMMNPWALAWAPYETSRRLASAVGCTGDDDDEVVECLRQVDATELVRASEEKASTPRDRDRLLLFPFSPTLEEEKVPGVETFVTAAPEQLIMQGCQHDVPYLAGMNTQEWMLTIANNLRIIDSDWKKYVFPETRLPDDCKKIPEAMEELREFFLSGNPLTLYNLQGFKDMLTDLHFGEGIYFGMKYLAKWSKNDLFFYSLIVDRELNFLKNLNHLNFPGTSHADDLGYLFQTHVSPNVSSDSLAFIIRKKMVRMNPTPHNDPLIGKKWRPYTSKKRNYLEIGDELKTRVDLNKKRVQFWEKFYKKYGAKRENKKKPACPVH